MCPFDCSPQRPGNRCALPESSGAAGRDAGRLARCSCGDASTGRWCGDAQEAVEPRQWLEGGVPHGGRRCFTMNVAQLFQDYERVNVELEVRYYL